MLVWKKHSTSNLKIFYFIFLLSWPVLLLAKTSNVIEIKNVNASFVDQKYQVNADFKYVLGDEIQEALNHGIGLQIDIQINAKQQREWLWNTTIKSSTISYLLKHHPLSGHYQITNLGNHRKKHFQNLQSALDYISSIKNYNLLDQDNLNPDKIYIAGIRAKLNIQNLPAPLRLLAYISSDWQLNCPWHEWKIKQ